MSIPATTTAPPDLQTAVAHHQAGRIPEAEAIYRQVLLADPHNADALHLLGVVQLQRGRPQEAIDLISQSLAGQPENHHALNHLGEAFRASGFLEEATTCFERALALNGRYFQACNNLGNAYQAMGRLDIAMSWFQKALEINPDYAEAHANLGNAFQETGRYDAAVTCYERALELRPDFPEASFNLGNLYKSLRRYDAAIPRYRKTISLNPASVDAYLALGRCFHEVGERDQAMECFHRVMEREPENAEARWALVMTELALVHDDQADVEHHRHAFARKLKEVEHWLTQDRARSAYGVVGSQQPFYLAYEEQNNRDLLSEYGGLCRRLAASWQDDEGLVLRRARRAKGPIRVGLVSAHICDHSVWHALIKGWCLNLDPQRVQLHIFHLGRTVDRETEIGKARASRFVQGLVRPQQWARAILAEPLDVLIYPEIGMDSMAVKLAALRLAPVQATTWGHPETSGLPTMDYFVSAAEFEPEDAQQYYSERLVMLPHLGCCYEPLDIAPEGIALHDLGLDGGEPLFVCPGTPFKYAPRHDWIYPAIAKQLGRCRFAFFKYPLESLSRHLMRRLNASFTQAGLAFEDHVVELPWLSKGQFASLMRQADAYLDTIGFSGFNTAMQAVDAGLPIVTREGRFLRGRLASGILRRMGITELIAETEQDYVNFAVALARDRRFGTELRDRIERSRNVLYDDLAPVRALEEFFMKLTN